MKRVLPRRRGSIRATPSRCQEDEDDGRGRIAVRRGRVDSCAVEGGSRRKQRILSRPVLSILAASVFIKPSKWLAFICSCDVSVKPAGSGKMIDVRSIPFGTRGRHRRTYRSGRETGPRRKRKRKNIVDPRGVSRGRERETADDERGDLGSQRDWSIQGGVFRGTY